MSAIVLGFDTSCYTTSAAAVSITGEVIASARKLLPVAAGERGLRQSEMVFLHTRQMPEVVGEIREAVRGMRIAAVCASARPRDDKDSYMPAFHVGDALAHSLSALLGVPCFDSTHQRGHFRAALHGSGLNAEKYLALHLSGGTTDLILMDRERLMVLGGSLDLHAGQLIDRTGVMLGLGFPAGPRLEELAKRGHGRSLLGVNMDDNDLCCHMSGAETRVKQWIADQSRSAEDIAAEVFDFLARTVTRMISGGCEASGARNVLITGGVASSLLFREMLAARVQKQRCKARLFFGAPEFSGDNAVGVALIGADRYRNLTGNGNADCKTAGIDEKRGERS